MSTAPNDRIKVRPRYWRDKNTGEQFPLIQIWWRDRYVNIPYDQARRVVDEVHDLCDLHERGQRKPDASTTNATPPGRQPQRQSRNETRPLASSTPRTMLLTRPAASSPTGSSAPTIEGMPSASQTKPTSRSTASSTKGSTMTEPTIEVTAAEEIPATDTNPAAPVTGDAEATPSPELEASQDTDKEGEPGGPAPLEREEQPESGGPAAKARKEAARYRAQLRTVQGRANAMRDQLIEHELGPAGVKLAALTAAGVDLDSLVGEDGRISPEAVQTAAQTARETLGIPNNRFQGTADQGRARPHAEKPAPTWGTLLDPTQPTTR